MIPRHQAHPFGEECVTCQPRWQDALPLVDWDDGTYLPAGGRWGKRALAEGFALAVVAWVVLVAVLGVAR
jgi:hypothetical protein